MILIGTVQGDVIESGGVKNVTKHYHYNEMKKTFVDDYEADTDGEAHDLRLPTEEPVTMLPDQLCTPPAREVLDKLYQAGIVNQAWKPVGLTGAEKSILAVTVAERLYIHNHWAFFGELWTMEKETLRQANVKAMNQEGSGIFMDRLKAALG